jgi:hypothetical protein
MAPDQSVVEAMRVVPVVDASLGVRQVDIF